MSAPLHGVRSILVRGPNWVGDLIMSTPGFRALRIGYPEARIVLHVRKGLEPLVRGAPWFDEVVTLDPGPRGARAFAHRLSSLRRQGAALRAAHGPFDLGLCIPDSFSSALLMRSAGARSIVGYRRSGRGWLLQRPVTPPREWGRRRLVARERFVLGLTSAIGCKDEGSHLELHTTDDEERRADRLLAEAGLDGPRPWIVVAPGASFGPSKLWPVESFAAVGDAMAREGIGVAILGAPGERDLAERVRDTMTAPAAVLAGRADLGTAKAILRRAALLVCNDAGARHMAVAFGVPTVVLMGPTSLAKTDLNLERVRVLSSDVPCSPCYRRECPIDHRCMTRLEPVRVIEIARETLDRPRPGTT